MMAEISFQTGCIAQLARRDLSQFVATDPRSGLSSDHRSGQGTPNILVGRKLIYKIDI